MATVLCQICLRTDITAVNIATELADFIDELCDFNFINDPRFKYCSICAHLLKKFYNFKQRCLKACQILKSHRFRQKLLPTDLHKQIPSSIGLCTSLAPYRLLEHQDPTDTDLLETKPDLNNEPDITPNIAYYEQNFTIDPALQDHIEVKDEPMHHVPDSNVKTLQAQNLYLITTSDGNLILRSDLEDDIRSAKLDKQELSTNGSNKDVTKDHAKQSKIGDFVKSFEVEIENDTVDGNDMEIVDSTFMLNDDPLKDHESLNAMDDIESDIKSINKDEQISDDHLKDDESINSMDGIESNFSDSNIKSINKDEQINDDQLKDDVSLSSMDDIESDFSDSNIKSINNGEKNAKSNVAIDSESDTESLIEFFENAIKNNNLKVKVSEINDLEVAETLLKLDTKNKLLKKRILFLKAKAEMENGFLKSFKDDGYDLGDGVKISKEAFLKMYEICENNSATHRHLDTNDKQKTDKFLRTLYTMYNPEYETVFDIEYLDTEEKKIQEFNRRKDNPEYLNAPFKCTRCYKGFHLKGLLTHHMRKHDESGPLQCHICTFRFHTAAARRSHMTLGHMAAFVCRLCNVTFHYLTTMKNHFESHKGVEYNCPECDGIFRTNSAWMHHKRSHATSHICTTCAYSAVSAYGLDLHKKLKHRGAPAAAAADAVPCSSCNLTLDSQKVYERHMKISHRPYRFKCLCCKNFTTLAELRQHKVDEGHLRWKNVKKLFPGPYQKNKIGAGTSAGTSGKSAGTSGKSAGTSGKSAGTSDKNVGTSGKSASTLGKSKDTSDKSKRKSTPKRVALRTCPICQEQVPNLYGSSLYCHFAEQHPGVHYRTEDVQRWHLLCELCGQTFDYMSHFVDHKNTHLGLRPYACAACPARFATRQQRTRHRSVLHRGLAPCEHCGTAFKSGSHRFAHMRSHANIRSFKCKVCGAGFTSPGSMREHVRGVHLGERRRRAPRKHPPDTKELED